MRGSNLDAPRGGATGDRRKSWKLHQLPQRSLPEQRGLHTPTHTPISEWKLGMFLKHLSFMGKF